MPIGVPIVVPCMYTHPYLIGHRVTSGRSERCVYRRRKARTIFTVEQMFELEKRFQEQKYLTVPERVLIASQLALTEQQVKTWFQNRRTKWKRESKKTEGNTSDLDEQAHHSSDKEEGTVEHNSELEISNDNKQ